MLLDGGGGGLTLWWPNVHVPIQARGHVPDILLYVCSENNSGAFCDNLIGIILKMDPILLEQSRQLSVTGVCTHPLSYAIVYITYHPCYKSKV